MKNINPFTPWANTTTALQNKKYVKKIYVPVKFKIFFALVLAMLLLSGLYAKAAISHVASTSATGATITLPTGWQAGDLALVFAFRDGSTTAPSLATGFTTITTGSATIGTTNASALLAYRVLQVGDGSLTFTFTNATEHEILVLRGTATSNPIVAKFVANGGSSNTMSYSGLTGGTLSSSWITGFGGHRTATDVNTRTVTGMTIRSASTTTLGMHSMTGTTSFTSRNWSTVNNRSRWVTIVAEILESTDPTFTVAPNNLDFSFAYTGGNSASQSFQLSGSNLTGFPSNISVSAPSTDFQVSNDNSTWGAATTVAYTSATLGATPVYVRFTPQSSGEKSGNVTFTGGGVTSPPTVALTGTGTAPATQLAFVSFPAAGFININFTSFTVEARSSDNSVDYLFNGDIILEKASGPGTLSGTTTVAAINGVATFSAVQVNLAGSYTLSASSGTLTQATSGIIVVTAPAVNDYRSANSGNWNSLATWVRWDGDSWETPTSVQGTPTNSSGTITVTSHTVTVTAVVSVDQVIVASGGKVTVNNVTMTIAQGTGDDFVVNGTVELTGTSGAITTTGNLVFNAGSTYIHDRNGGTIPIATWDDNSTCTVTGVVATVPTIQNNQSFGNFVWNCTGQTSYGNTITQTGMSIKGDLIIQSTNTNRDIGLCNTANSTLNVGGDLIINSATAVYRVCYINTTTLNVAGDVIISGGTLVMNSSENTTTPDYVGTINVEGDVTITSGTLNFSENGRCDEGDDGIINVKGNFTHTGGTITELGGSSGNTINFAGTTIQTYTSGGTVANTVNFNVNTGAILYTGASLLGNGSIGTFTLADGGTLGIGDPAGITSSGSTGNVRVSGTRTYSPAANYIYNGTSAQNTGNGLPATVNNLTFNNTIGAVTFTSVCAVTNNFSITAGSKANLGLSLSHSAGTLILGGNPQIGCSYGSSASGATVKNDTYFENTGIVTTGTCPNGLWIGVGSTNWHTASNWLLNGELPTANDDVIISSAAPYQPVVLATNTASCKNLTINNGATLTILPLGQATISETLNNNGTLNLESDATGSASLIVNTYSGNPANIKLYLTGENWHYISSPVLGINETTFFDNNDETWDLAHFKEDISLSLFPSQTQYNWQMSWVGYDGWSYFDGSPTGFSSTPMVIGKGYNFWDENTAAYTLTGSINTQQTSQPITVTDRGIGSEGFEGFNLLGNPFSCGLNINTMFSSSWPASTYTAVYFTSNGQPLVYSTDVMVPGDAIPGFIPPMQGFFIKTDAAGTFTFPLGARVHTSVNHYKKGGDETLISLVRLSISENGKKDETVIRFDKSAKTGADYNFDAPRFIQPQDKPGIYTSINGQDFTINGMPFPESSVEIPVTVELLAAGNHVITAMEIQELANYKVSLKDKSTGSTVDLNSVKEYSFSAPAGEIKDRFILAITNLSTDIEDPLAAEKLFNIYHGFGLINIQPLSDEWDGVSGSVKIMDLSGKPVRVEPNAEFNKNTLIQLPAPDKAGLYFVEIRSGMMKFTGKVLVK